MLSPPSLHFLARRQKQSSKEDTQLTLTLSKLHNLNPFILSPSIQNAFSRSRQIADGHDNF
jgi:hypothetical protein